ncbi:MAG: iron-containing alcohol dehydrogenase [Desulfatibacillaceae bacterium]
MDFEFATSNRIVFGPGAALELGAMVPPFGNRALVVTGANAGRHGPVIARLGERDYPYITFAVDGEPTTETVRDGVARAREAGCKVVVGIGGGSVLDAGKAIAALLANPGDVTDYLEVVGRGMPLAVPSAPYVAVPTTAGTGAEVTKNAVLRSPEHGIKVSMRSPAMLPSLAVVDPLLTVSMPPQLTVATGMDALTQLVEAYVSSQSNPMCDGLCREGIRRAACSLRLACEDGDDLSAREDMSLASLFGGIVLANTKLGAVHGLSAPLGGRWNVPHGAACARLLPFVMEANIENLMRQAPGSTALERYAEVASMLTGRSGVVPADGVVWARDLVESERVRPLSHYGIGMDDFPEIIEKANQSSSMAGNPVPLPDEALAEVLEKAL